MTFKDVRWGEPRFEEQPEQEITRSMELEIALSDLEMSLDRVRSLIKESNNEA
jgi:hypothetical protein